MGDPSFGRDSKTGRRGDPEDDRFLGTGILKPMLLFRRQVETLPFHEFEGFFSKSKGHPSPQDEPEFLPFVGSLLGCDLPFPQGEEDGFQTPVCRAGNEELEPLYFLLLDGYAVVLPVHNLLHPRGLAKEIGDIFVQGLQDLDQAVQGDRGQIPFDLRDEPFRQAGSSGQFLLGQITQLPEISNPLSNLHKPEAQYNKNLV